MNTEEKVKGFEKEFSERLEDIWDNLLTISPELLIEVSEKELKSFLKTLGNIDCHTHYVKSVIEGYLKDLENE